MLKKFALVALTTSALTSLSPIALAEEGQDLISLGVGYYDILDDEDAVDLRLEYRPGHEYFWNIQPWLGVEATSDASVWAGGGFLLDYEFTENWYVTPSVGVGLYAQGSSDLDLGHPIEFRSQLEVAHEWDSGHRAGLAFGHLSNASLDSNNPGTEVLNVYWHIPY